MRLYEYFKLNSKDRHGPDSLEGALAELARGCAREGFVTRVLLPSPPSCVCCDSTEGLCPMRILVGGEQVAALMCLRCQKRIAKPTMISQMIYEVRCGIRDAEYDTQQALLFQQGQRIRIVWGYKLGSEVLS